MWPCQPYITRLHWTKNAKSAIPTKPWQVLIARPILAPINRIGVKRYVGPRIVGRWQPSAKKAFVDGHALHRHQDELARRLTEPSLRKRKA